MINKNSSTFSSSSITIKICSRVTSKSGLVWCSNQKLLRCLSSRYHCKNLEKILQTSRYNLVESPQTVISIIGHNNPTVICVNGGRLKFYGNIHYNLTII